MKTSRKIDKGIIFLILIIIIVGATVLFFYNRTKTDRIADAIEKEEPITAAFLVTDGEGELLFTEIFFYHPFTKKGAILDIPSQTGVVIPSLDKIDRISLLFNPKKPEIFLGEISSLIDFPIPYYFVLTLDEIEDQVDLVEGLDLFNANPLELPQEKVFLPSGSLVLDGAKTVLFLSFLEEGAHSIEQTDRWEKFAQSLLKTWGTRQEFLLHSEVFPVFRGNMKTNMGDQALKSYVAELEKLDSGRMVFQRVLGVERVVDDKTLLFRHKDGVLLRETVRQTMKSIGNMDVVSDEELGATLEILNGTETIGLATRTSQLYQSFGYDVAEIGNADTFDVEYTLVIDRGGDISRAQRVASVIKCSRVERRLEVPDLGDGAILDQTIDVTVILGKDFDGRYCKE